MTTLLPVRRESRDLWDVAGEMNRVFDSPFELLPFMASREGLWHPTIDVYNLADEIVVEAELPGIKMEDVDLRIEENHLILEGTRRRAKDYKEEERFYTERLYGAFHRVVHLPSDVDANAAEARFVEGLLIIRLPKTRRAEGTRINIKTQ